MAHRNMEIIRGSSNQNWQLNQQKKSMIRSSSNKSTTPTFNPLCIIDPSTGRRYKRFEDMYTMTPLRGLVKQGSNNNNNNDVSNLDSPLTSLGGNINISKASLNLGQIGSSSYDPQERSTFQSYPPPSQYEEPGLSVGGSGHQGVSNANIDVNLVWDPNKSSNNFQIGAFSQTPLFETQTSFPSMQYVEPAGLPGGGSQQGVNYSNMDVNQFWDINQYSNNSQNTLGEHSPIFETQTNVPTVVEPVPQNGGNHSAYLNQEAIIMSEAEANRSILFEIAEKLGVSLDSPSPNNQQDDVDLLYSTNAPSSSTSGLIRPQTFPYGDQPDQFPMDAFDHVTTIPELPEQSIVIPQFPMEASFQPNTTLVPQSTQQEYGNVVGAGISVPSLPDFPSFFSHQGSSYVTTVVSVPSLPDFPPFSPLQESGVVTSGVSLPNLPEFPPSFTDQGSSNFIYGVSIPALPDFPQTFTHQGNNNGGMAIRALETILEAEDNMGRNNMNASVQWTPPVGKQIVNRAYDTVFVELGQPVDPHLRFFMNMQGNSSNP